MSERVRAYLPKVHDTGVHRIHHRDEEGIGDVLGVPDRGYTDLDKTALPEKGSELCPDMTAQWRRAQTLGFLLRAITGRPYEEAALLVQNMPSDLRVRVVYETGAYVLRSNPGEEGFRKERLLATEALEEQVALVKADLENLSLRLRQAVGVVLLPNGKGERRIALEFNVLPEGFEGDDDDAMGARVTTEDQLTVVRRVIEDWLAGEVGKGMSWNVSDAGVVDIHPEEVHKGAAIRKLEEGKNGTGTVFVFGDSANDGPLFEELKRLHPERGRVVTVVTPSTPDELIYAADVAVVGEGNMHAVLAAILDKRELEAAS